jgi:hypothetical protein
MLEIGWALLMSISITGKARLQLGSVEELPFICIYETLLVESGHYLIGRKIRAKWSTGSG